MTCRRSTRSRSTARTSRRPSRCPSACGARSCEPGRVAVGDPVERRRRRHARLRRAIVLESRRPFRHERGHGDEHGNRRRHRREVGRDLRARREGVEGRAARHRLHLHRGADLAPDRAPPPLLGHAGRRATQVHARRHRRRGEELLEQVQRDDVRRRPQPARLRARDERARARGAGTARGRSSPRSSRARS